MFSPTTKIKTGQTSINKSINISENLLLKKNETEKFLRKLEQKNMT